MSNNTFKRVLNTARGRLDAKFSSRDGGAQKYSLLFVKDNEPSNLFFTDMIASCPNLNCIKVGSTKMNVHEEQISYKFFSTAPQHHTLSIPDKTGSYLKSIVDDGK